MRVECPVMMNNVNLSVMMNVAVTRRMSASSDDGHSAIRCRGSHYIYIYYRCTFFVSGMEATPASAPRANGLNAAQHPDQKTGNNLLYLVNGFVVSKDA